MLTHKDQEQDHDQEQEITVFAARISGATNSPTFFGMSAAVAFSLIFWTMALPTTIASATCATSRACSAVEIPKPTAIGNVVCRRMSATWPLTEEAMLLWTPVTPSRET